MAGGPAGHRLRAVWRLLRTAAHVLRGTWIVVLHFPRLPAAARAARIQWWSARTLALMGVRLEASGQPRPGAKLLVANHISWLDILVMNAARPAHFVSKADVRHWPVLGALVTGAGTLYIERERRRDAMRVVHKMAEHLREGDVLAVFPEGTTGDGLALLPFHANLIQAAISAEAPALPVGLSYVDAVHRRRHDAPLFIGDTTLLRSLWNTLRATDVVAVVHYGEPQRAEGRDRRRWATDLREAVVGLREP